MSQNWSQIIEGLIGYYLDPNWNEHHNQSRRLFENREYQYRVFRRNIQEIFDVDILENMSIEDALAKFGIAPWLENWNISLDLSNVTAIFKFEIYRVENVLCGDSQYSSPSFNSADSLFEAWEIFLISLRRVEEEGRRDREEVTCGPTDSDPHGPAATFRIAVPVRLFFPAAPARTPALQWTIREASDRWCVFSWSKTSKR